MSKADTWGHSALDLGGEWTFEAGATSASEAPLPTGELAAIVPGCVHTDLERAGLVVPLAIGGDGPAVDWIGRTAWTYRREFTVSDELSRSTRIELVFDGLQGVAQIELDGRVLIDADNQFRAWRIDVTGLAPGEHTLAVHFHDTSAWLARAEAGRQLPGWGVGQDKDSSGAWLRASPVMFGWDFAPRAVTCGIWRGVRVEGLDGARIDSVSVAQSHESSGAVTLTVAPRIVRGADEAEELLVRAELRLAGHRVAVARGDGRGELRLAVDQPQLWWPNGEGRATLYDLTVEVFDEQNRVLARERRRVGLRRIELVRERTGTGDAESHEESFHFRVNGRDVCVRGANWVPPQLHDAHEDVAHVEHLVGLAQRAHFNMLRVWGGGPYASEGFYDACDRAGILVWQDLPFACCTYPTFDDAFLANVAVELREQCRRLHHRASLALLCGNNELENGLVENEWTDKRMSWRDYSRLFDELAPRIVAEEAPGVAWWPGSPHSPLGDRMAFNDPRSGDAHLWDVWHGDAPFTHFQKSRHRFVSEFGFQSPPKPNALARLGDAAAQTQSASRQRSANGEERIDRYLAREGFDPAQLEPVQRAHLVRLVHALGLGLAMEHFRRSWPRCGGFLLWQFNEPWLAPTWSIVDARGSCKPAFAAAARACATKVLGLWHDPETDTIHAAYTDNSQTSGAPCDWSLEVRRLTDGPGATVLESRSGRCVTTCGTQAIFEEPFADWCSRLGVPAHEMLIQLTLVDHERRQRLAQLVPAPIGHWNLCDPQLAIGRARPVANGHQKAFNVEVQVRHHAPFPIAEHGALAVECEPALRILSPDRPSTLIVRTERRCSAAELLGGLTITTLWNLTRGERSAVAR